MNQRNETIRQIRINMEAINSKVKELWAKRPSLEKEEQNKLDLQINQLNLDNHRNKTELKKLLKKEGVEL
jgi:hypothetical protein